MILTPYGFREWIMVTAMCSVAAAMSLVIIGAYSLTWAIVVASIIGVVWLAILSFFRDPIRALPRNLQWGDMICPADGTVSAVERVEHHEATDGPAVVVRIFLSILNVHVNRAPFDGEVVTLRYRPGKFLNAQTAESAKVNESNLITFRIETGESIGVRQVSGMVARRIVCPLRVGDRLKRGQKFGMIKFGSTTELILPRPEDVTVHVEKGDRVRGMKTILATIVKPGSQDGDAGDGHLPSKSA